MCQILNISRSHYYNYKEYAKIKDPLTDEVKYIFRDNKKTYGARRIKAALKTKGYTISRRRTGRIMAEEGLISVDTKAQYKVHQPTVNKSSADNGLNRAFNDRYPLEAIVSDLTCVRVKNRWQYICTMMDLYNREIIGYSVGLNKDAQLVHQAFSNIDYD